MKVLIALLTVIGWATTALAAFLFGILLEHDEGEHPTTFGR